MCKYLSFWSAASSMLFIHISVIQMLLLSYLMCGGGVRIILLLPLVARCLETIDVCIWCMFVFMSVVVTVWWSVGTFVV